MNFLYFHSQFNAEDAWNLLILKLQEIQARAEFLDFFYKLLSEKFVTLLNSPGSLPHVNIHTKQKFTMKFNETCPVIEETLHQILTSVLCTHYHLQIRPCISSWELPILCKWSNFCFRNLSSNSLHELYPHFLRPLRQPIPQHQEHLPQPIPQHFPHCIPQSIPQPIQQRFSLLSAPRLRARGELWPFI